MDSLYAELLLAHPFHDNFHDDYYDDENNDNNNNKYISRTSKRSQHKKITICTIATSIITMIIIDFDSTIFITLSINLLFKEPRFWIL